MLVHDLSFAKIPDKFLPIIWISSDDLPSKKRKTLELSAEPLPFYKEARPVLSRMVKMRELVSFLRENTSKELSHAGLTVHYVVYADDIAEYAYNGR